MGSDPIASKTFDVTPKQREVIEWRAKRRLELRNQYLKEIHNPNNKIEGHLFDPQVQRYYTAYFSYEKNWKPRVKNFLWLTTVLFGSWSALYFWAKDYRDGMEHKYRTGQISYRDRDGKFA